MHPHIEAMLDAGGSVITHLDEARTIHGIGADGARFTLRFEAGTPLERKATELDALLTSHPHPTAPDHA